MISGPPDGPPDGSNGKTKFRPPPFPAQRQAAAPAAAANAPPAKSAARATNAGAARAAGQTQNAPAGRVAAPSTLELLDRVPPQDLEAEKALLGSILVDPDKWDEVVLIARQKDFYLAGHAQIFGAMREIADEGKRTDAVLLRNRLKKLGILEDVGGMSYLAEIADCVPTAHNAEFYAELVANAASARALIDVGAEMIRAGYDPGVEPRERLNRAEAQMFKIFDGRSSRAPQAVGDVLVEALAEIDRRAELQGIAGLKTGFAPLDLATGGLREMELTVLAARPSAGKSALAANIAEHVAIDQRKGVLFVSLEMSNIEIGERMLCCRARVNSRECKNGLLTEIERRQLIKASNELSAAPLHIDAAPSRNMTEIASIARRMKRQQQLALVIVDYLQLVEPENPKDIREQQVAQISKRLKRLAREVRVPILCLAQLNRESEKSEEPHLRHLRESGSIEQDADNVWMLHQLDEGKPPEEGQRSFRAKLFLRKQRGGEKTAILLNWSPVWTLFEAPEMQTEF